MSERNAMRMPRPRQRVLDEAWLDAAIAAYPRTEMPENLVGSSMALIREEAKEGRARVPAPRFRLQFLDLALGAFFAAIGGLAGLIVWNSFALPGSERLMASNVATSLETFGLGASFAEVLPSTELALLLPLGGLLVLGLASLIVLTESMPGQTASHARR